MSGHLVRHHTDNERRDCRARVDDGVSRADPNQQRAEQHRRLTPQGGPRRLQRTRASFRRPASARTPGPGAPRPAGGCRFRVSAGSPQRHCPVDRGGDQQDGHGCEDAEQERVRPFDPLRPIDASAHRSMAYIGTPQSRAIDDLPYRGRSESSVRSRRAAPQKPDTRLSRSHGRRRSR